MCEVDFITYKIILLYTLGIGKPKEKKRDLIIIKFKIYMFIVYTSETKASRV